MSPLSEIEISDPEQGPSASDAEKPSGESSAATYSATAFSVLTGGLGMREADTLLEIGCGDLTTARLLIPFLDAARYHGYDTRRDRIDRGIARSCGRDLIDLKSPRFECAAAFQATLFRRPFDFILLHADSLPASGEALRTLLEETVACMAPAARVVAALPRDAASARSLEAFVDLASSLGLSVELLGLETADDVRWAVLRKTSIQLGLPQRPRVDEASAEATDDGTEPAAPGSAASSGGSENARRLEQELARYADCIEVHNLPEIYHFWSNRFLLPKLQSCGFDSVEDFFTRFVVRTCEADPETTHQIISLGAGNCDLEVDLAQRAREQGVTNFHFHCLELNPVMVERGKELAREHDFADQFSFLVTDIAGWRPEHEYSICIANHSLHHFEELEMIFDKVKKSLRSDGVFLTNDMIGRNGHMRWPEALVEVERIWNELPERYKYNHQLKRLETEFVNWDCSTEGNEGIRAQDILPLLLEHFHFEVFIAFANLIDIFVDRSFGHNFDPEKEEDLAIIREVAELDDAMLDEGEIKPTHMIAAMRVSPVEDPIHYRHWNAEFCVRYPD